MAGTRGRPARRAVRANMQAARPGLRVLASASRRPARPQRPRHASRVAADPPFALPFGEFFLSHLYKVVKHATRRVSPLARGVGRGARCRVARPCGVLMRRMLVRRGVEPSREPSRRIPSEPYTEPNPSLRRAREAARQNQEVPVRDGSVAPSHAHSSFCHVWGTTPPQLKRLQRPDQCVFETSRLTKGRKPSGKITSAPCSRRGA